MYTGEEIFEIYKNYEVPFMIAGFIIPVFTFVLLATFIPFIRTRAINLLKYLYKRFIFNGFIKTHEVTFMKNCIVFAAIFRPHIAND